MGRMVLNEWLQDGIEWVRGCICIERVCILRVCVLVLRHVCYLELNIPQTHQPCQSPPEIQSDFLLIAEVVVRHQVQGLSWRWLCLVMIDCYQ